jgi:hypothetical protein
MLKLYRYSFICVLTLLTTTGFGQQDTKTIYVDSTNRLFVSPTAPVNIYVGTTPDGSNAIKLISIDKKGDPLYWNGHGPIQMTHLDLYIGRRIKFELFADGIPPQSELMFNKSTQKDSKDILYLSGGSIIEINAADADAGLYKTFISVNGEPYKEYAHQVVFDKEGLYEIKVYSVDNLGNKEDEVTRRFIVDSTPPSSALSVEGDKHENTLSGRAILSLTAVDSFGVNNIKYRLDSSEFAVYQKPIQTARITEGEHTLKWFASDKVGNIEFEQTYTFFVDKTPPMVFEEIVGNSYMVGDKEFSSGRSQLKVAAVDNKAGVKEIYYSLNSGEFIKYEKPVLLSDIMGTMNVKSYAVDNVNNRSQSGASAESFSMPTIDITGPTLIYKLDGPKFLQRDTMWIGPSTKIHINAKDNEAGVNRVVYSINKSTETDYSAPFTITQNGHFLVKCTGFDNVDNLNFLSFEVGVDNVAPELFYHFSVKPHKKATETNETLDIYSSDVKIFLAATDNLSGEVSINYTIDQGNPIVYRNPIEKLTSGKTYTLNISVVDKLGNKTEESIKFKVE